MTDVLSVGAAILSALVAVVAVTVAIRARTDSNRSATAAERAAVAAEGAEHQARRSADATEEGVVEARRANEREEQTIARKLEAERTAAAASAVCWKISRDPNGHYVLRNDSANPQSSVTFSQTSWDMVSAYALLPTMLEPEGTITFDLSNDVKTQTLTEVRVICDAEPKGRVVPLPGRGAAPPRSTPSTHDDEQLGGF